MGPSWFSKSARHVNLTETRFDSKLSEQRK